MDFHAVFPENIARDFGDLFGGFCAHSGHLCDHEGIKIGLNLAEYSFDILIPHPRIDTDDALKVEGLGNGFTQGVCTGRIVRSINNNCRRVAHNLKAPR